MVIPYSLHWCQNFSGGQAIITFHECEIVVGLCQIIYIATKDLNPCLKISWDISWWYLMSQSSLKISTANLTASRPSWWCQNMETLTALLALCEGNRPLTSQYPSQRASDVEILSFLCCWPEQAGETNSQVSDDFRWLDAHVMPAMRRTWIDLSLIKWCVAQHIYCHW